jgi:YidC/Oxa1 family membrane protein insertase
MENQRLLLYFTLFFVVYLLWAQWQTDYGPKPKQTVTQVESSSVSAAAPTKDLPAADIPSQSGQIEQALPQEAGQRIHVTTDLLDVDIDTRGGDIRKIVLLDYAKTADKPDVKLALLTDDDNDFFIAQSGLVSSDAESAPTHNALYTAEKDSYRLQPGSDVIEVALHWQSKDGTRVTKLYRFHRGQYVVDVEHVIEAGNKDWSGSPYMQLVRTPPDKGSKQTFTRTYTGGVVYNNVIKYEKVSFDEIAKSDLKDRIGVDACLNEDTKSKGCDLQDGWLAMTQHYFLAAWLPDTGEINHYYSRKPSNSDRYILGTRAPVVKVAAGSSATVKSRFIAGPKLQDLLEKVAPGLELTVDYGVLTILAKPLFWLLEFFHGIFGNWGWAIIFLTITVKSIFFKLSEMSYRSMARMRKVAPRMKQMKEQYGDDRAAMSKAMMELYKREKINPLGGCFPILVQMPVFIALYWVLLESVEMRYAPFILWIQNLSGMDPYFILPVIMGISMWAQQKLNPAPVDPVQQKVFQFMPLVFTFMFAFFPSGLVLYWVVNNILSITQQWIITRSIEKGNAK